MKKILITGGAGFIGSHLCDFFLKKGFFVVALDNLITGQLLNIIHNSKNKNFKFFDFDITNKIELDYEFDFILNFASPASPKDFDRIPFKIIDSIVSGTKNILDFALKHNSKVLIASTSEVYGNPITNPQSENYNGNVSTTSPRSVYDESKRFTETLASTYAREYNLDIKIPRIFNTYGPRMRRDDGRVIPNFINQIIEGKNLTVYGDGNQTRSFCYVDDLVDGLYKLLISDCKEPVNLGNPVENSINNLANLCYKLFDSKKNIIYKELPIDDPVRRKPNIDLAISKLNWEPKINLKDGLIKTYNYFIKDYNNNS